MHTLHLSLYTTLYTLHNCGFKVFTFFSLKTRKNLNMGESRVKNETNGKPNGMSNTVISFVCFVVNFSHIIFSSNSKKMFPNKKHILTSQEAISKGYFLFLINFQTFKKYIKIK